MKKLIAALLVLMLILSLTACAPTGTVEGQTYRNENFGIGCTLDDNWTLKGNYAEDDMTYDLYATNSATNEQLYINVATIEAEKKDMSDEEYLQELSGELITEMENNSYKNVEATVTAFNVAGQEYKGINLVAEYTGVKVYETLVMVRDGRYSLLITVASAYPLGCSEILAEFHPVFD